MDAYTLQHYRRKTWSWITENFKFLKGLSVCIPPVIALVVSGFVVLYAIIMGITAANMGSDGITIIYWVLLKGSFVVALKFALPLLLMAAGIFAIFKILD
jgi:hypothetical protein